MSSPPNPSRLFLVMLALASLLAVVAPPTVPPAAAAAVVAPGGSPNHVPRSQEGNDTARLWDGSGLTGSNIILGQGIYFADALLTVADNTASSLRVGSGAVVWLCDNAQAPDDQGSRSLGRCHVFKNQTITNLAANDFDDKTTTVVVTAGTGQRAAVGATAYSDNSFSGARQDFKGGAYDYADIVNGVGNDQISSLQVAPGFETIVCEHGSGHAQTPLDNSIPEGALCRYFPSGDYSAMSNYGLNDVISFLSVVRVASNPAVVGEFSDVKQWPVSAIHQYLMTDGRVMFNEQSPDDGNPSTGEYAIWDPATDEIVTESTFAPGTNMFCGGYVHLPNGNLFGVATGGGGNTVDTTMEYHVDTGRWELAPAMNWKRYYPSAAVTPSGSVLAIGGNDVFGQAYGQGVIAIEQPEIYEDGQWRSLPGANIAFSNLRGPTNDASYWPWVQAAPNGEMFMAGPDVGMRFINTDGQGSLTELGNRDSTIRTYGSYVTFDEGKMLIAGGANSTDSASIIDFTTNNPTVSPTSTMNYGRRQHDMTLLADGTTFVNGGNDDGAETYSASGTLYVSELWDPATGQWLPTADSVVSRQYHSSSLLLPDGRVTTAGQCGGPPCERNAEIYSPPYLFAPDGSPAVRPRVTNVKAQWAYGESVTVGYGSTDVERAHLIKLGAVTHATNFEQRLVPLDITGNGGSSLAVASPSGGNLAPPGHYMLFLVNSDGVPSVGEIVQVGVVDAPPPPTAADIMPILEWRVELTNAPGIDVNGDGTVNVLDALELAQQFAGDNAPGD